MKTGRQVRRLRREFHRHGNVSRAAQEARMDRKTGRKYLETTKMPSELSEPHTWRTREDPFADAWLEVEEWLTAAPELEAKALFEFLMEEHGGKFVEGQVRTFQRRVRDWRALHGPEQEVFFRQEHRPGEAMQLDFWDATELGVTVLGEPFPHLLGHLVLPFSNWEYACTCRSESMLAVRRTVQRGVRKLSHVTTWLQIDNSSAATHRPGAEERLESDEEGRKQRRPFNEEFDELVRHFGMKPRTIAVGKSQQNGDVEALNNAMRRRLVQHLLLRGSRDFEGREVYEAWLEGILDKVNAWRGAKVAEELKHLRPLRVSLLPEYKEYRARVLTGSTISVLRNIYSVPSRLKGFEVTARTYEDRIEVFYKDRHQLTMPRLTGRNNALINYRHIIHSLVRKPGAFRCYKYRDQMFPTEAFRRAYDALADRMDTYKADSQYLRILKLAADTMESEVSAALELLLEQGLPFDSDDVRDLVQIDSPQVPEMPTLVVDLSEYDGLLQNCNEEAA